MKRRYMYRVIALILVMLAGSSIIFADGDHDHGDGDEQVDSALIERGYEVFVVNGCVACHGENAGGSDIGPALAGHSEFAIRRQVRTPTNIMLVFSPAQIPAEDLDALVAYILSLEADPSGGHEHDMGGITTGDLVFAHHWFLWLELEMGDVDGSIHHTAHILELLMDGSHKAMMQPVLTALGEGDLEAARTIVEPMITDVGEFSHDLYTIGMQLTYQAITVDDLEAAIHFATDLSEHDLTDEQLETVTDTLELVEACAIDDAVIFIETILGDDLYFVPDAMEMGDEDMNMTDDHTADDHSSNADDHSSNADDHSSDADDHSGDADDHSGDADDHDEMDTVCGEHND